MESSAPLKILLFGDASNFNRCLAEGLRRLGHKVTVASDGSRWMNTGRDIDLSRPLKGKLGGLLLWLKIKRLLRTKLKGFDIVSISGVSCLKLRPGRIGEVIDCLHRNNRAVFNTALSTDSNYVEACLSPDFLRYNEYMVDSNPAPLLKENPNAASAWLTPELKALTNKVLCDTDGTVSALYEYHRACSRILPTEKLAYGGIPIDVKAIEVVRLEVPRRVNIFLGRHSYRQAEKGTDLLYEIARRVVDRHPDRAELTLAEDLPYDEYLTKLRDAHIVLDQVYSYTPATNALLAMAMGKVVVSGSEPEFYKFIGEDNLHPIINADPANPEALEQQLEALVLNPLRLLQLGRESRLFVEKHNDTEIVAQRFLDFWNSRLKNNR